MKKQFLGFTLAEVLIVLGIIGIVAEMTIPSMISNFQDSLYKTAYKKAYSVASQAWSAAYAEGALTLCPSWFDGSGNTCNQDNFNVFKSKFKVLKDCGTTTANCWNMSGEQSWGGSPTTSAPSFIDASGMSWSKLSSTTTTSPELLVDTNGNKGPNAYGKDRAIFVPFYSSYNNGAYKTNVPEIYLYPDFPNSDTTNWANNEQLNRCPSMNISPCYYTSWIVGSK